MGTRDRQEREEQAEDTRVRGRRRGWGGREWRQKPATPLLTPCHDDPANLDVWFPSSSLPAHFLQWTSTQGRRRLISCVAPNKGKQIQLPQYMLSVMSLRSGGGRLALHVTRHAGRRRRRCGDAQPGRARQAAGPLSTNPVYATPSPVSSIDGLAKSRGGLD